MAQVIGPNGVETYVPDGVARCLVGDGGRGYAYASEKQAPKPEGETPKPAPRKRTPRKPKAYDAD